MYCRTRLVRPTCRQESAQEQTEEREGQIEKGEPLETEKKEEEKIEYSSGASGTVDRDGYNRRWERREQREEEIFNMEMEIDKCIASELSKERVDLSKIDYIEEQLEIGKLQIGDNRYEEEESFHFNAYIPAKYQWSEFDECCI
jgi:hypothetical protein